MVVEAAPDGVTFSGGEPTDQLEALVVLCRRLRKRGFSLVVFSGRTRAGIAGLPGGKELLSLIDVLVDGPYDASRPAVHGLRGSANQRIHLLSSRHRFEAFASRDVEVIIDGSGEIRLTGFPCTSLARAIRQVVGGR